MEHAPGFSAGVGLWVGVVCSSPERRPTFSENPGKILGKSWENLELAENYGSHLPEILGNSGIVCGCINHAPRAVSCDSAACED